jgi:hypothetical protein
MDIADLIENRFSEEELKEMQKMIDMQNNNIIIKKYIASITSQTKDTCDGLLEKIKNRQNDIKQLNNEFLENNKLFRHAMTNLMQ